MERDRDHHENEDSSELTKLAKIHHIPCDILYYSTGIRYFLRVFNVYMDKWDQVVGRAEQWAAIQNENFVQEEAQWNMYLKNTHVPIQ